MKRKNLIVKRKVEKINLLSKNIKIKKLYTKFEEIIHKIINKKDFAIAVSGGSDSLCLAYFSKIYSSKFKNNTYALIVDHKLRKESNTEALKVKKILSKKNIEKKRYNK